MATMSKHERLVVAAASGYQHMTTKLLFGFTHCFDDVVVTVMIYDDDGGGGARPPLRIFAKRAPKQGNPTL